MTMFCKSKVYLLGAIAGLLLLVIAPSVHAQLLANASRTIFLDTPTSFSSASTVTYHPGFSQYYGSQTGSPSSDGFVFGLSGGAPLQVLASVNIDPRAWNFNPNTGALEVISYNALTGGPGRGIIEAQLDAGGLLTGGTATLLAGPVTGLAASQTAPAYDPVADVLYSRGGTNVVNVVNRVTGALTSTIALNFVAAGNPTVPSDGVVFVPETQWLGVLDTATNSFAFFDLTGNYIGTSAFDIVTSSGFSRRPGYANGQLFVYDEARGGWQGYAVLGMSAAAIPVPVLGLPGLAILILVFGMVGISSARRLV